MVAGTFRYIMAGKAAAPWCKHSVSKVHYLTSIFIFPIQFSISYLKMDFGFAKRPLNFLLFCVKREDNVQECKVNSNRPKAAMRI